MKCSLCGFKFSQDEVETICKGCPLAKGCKLVRCPNCGYETPITPKWLRRLNERRRKYGELK